MPPRKITHGDSRKGAWAPEYRAWSGILTRCLNRRHKSWRNYGGRGIEVCDRWRDSYEAFLADVGRRPSPDHSIDRIDNDGNYEPGNVRWATRSEQMRNRRNVRWLALNGERLPLAAWVERLGISQPTLSQRLRAGWSAERALTTPVRPVRASRQE